MVGEIVRGSDCPILVRDCPLQKLPLVPSTKPLYDMLNLFQLGGSRLAIVVDAADSSTYKGTWGEGGGFGHERGNPASRRLFRRIRCVRWRARLSRCADALDAALTA